MAQLSELLKAELRRVRGTTSNAHNAQYMKNVTLKVFKSVGCAFHSFSFRIQINDLIGRGLKNDKDKASYINYTK